MGKMRGAQACASPAACATPAGGAIPGGRPVGGTGEDLSRVLTIPNLLSVVRLGLLAGFGVLVLSDHEYLAGAALLAVAGVTDFLDGYVARRYHQVSTLGKVLDPTVDRLVLGTAVIVITVAGAVPVWLASVVLAREALVGMLAVVLAGMGARRIDVTFLGKAGTFGLMWCFPLFLWGDTSGEWARVVQTIAWVAVVPSLGCSLAAAAGYVPRARRALALGRLEREHGGSV